MTDVAIVVPGILGSVLALNGEVVWPGTVGEYLAHDWLDRPYAKLPQLLSDHLEPLDVIRNVGPKDQYGSLLEGLERCGFSETGAGGKPPTLRVCPYDWRRDNAEAAARLDKLVAEIVKEQPDARITLVAHSMGGLVSRYYLESGDFPAARLASIRRLITLGTPHRGAPMALTAAVGKEKMLWLDAPQVQKMVNDPRFPANYQLLPPPGEPFAWSDETDGEFAPIDVYADEAITRLRLEPRNVQAARAFHAKLNLSRRPDHVRYFAFAGTSQVTISAVALERDGDGYAITTIDPTGAGDGTVPFWSAMLPGHQVRPVGGVHGVLFRDGYLRQTLATLLGHRGVLAGEAAVVEVNVREPVAHPNDLLHVALLLPVRATAGRDGYLQFERAQFDAAGKRTAYIPYGDRQTISRVGAAAVPETVSVALRAPDLQGVYRLAFYWQDEQVPAGQDEFFLHHPAPAPPA